MKIGNEGETEREEWGGSIADLVRLQSEFQGRILDETVRYLRDLQGALGPTSPGTVLKADEDLEITAEAVPGGTAVLTAEIENRQRVHTVVGPQIRPLVSREGTTWTPSGAGMSDVLLLAPGATETMELRVPVPRGLPPGDYRGGLLLVGFRRGAVRVRIDVAPDGESEAPGEEGDGESPGPTPDSSESGGPAGPEGAE